MKSTKAQKRVCDAIIRELQWWKSTNDINSPTITVDLHECLYADTEEYLDPDDREELERLLMEVLILIRNINP